MKYYIKGSVSHQTFVFQESPSVPAFGNDEAGEDDGDEDGDEEETEGEGDHQGEQGHHQGQGEQEQREHSPTQRTGTT